MDWWSRNNHDFKNYFEFDRKIRDCQYASPTDRSSKWIEGMRYDGDLDWFATAARDVLEWFMTPTTRDGHLKLQKEILEGDDLQGYLDLGRMNQHDYWKLNIMLAIIAATGLLAFIGGIGYQLYGKKTAKSAEKISYRAKAVPLFLVHIPLFALVGVLLVFVSVNLWATSSINEVYADNTKDGLKMANEFCARLVLQGNCNYEVAIVNGAQSIKESISKFSGEAVSKDQFQWLINNRKDAIKIDKKAVLEQQMTATKLVAQMNELKNLGLIDSKFADAFENVLNLIKTVEQDLGSIVKDLDDDSTYTQQLTKDLETEAEKINRAVLSASQPLLEQLENIKTGIKLSMKSVQNVCNSTIQWIDVVGRRNFKTIEKLNQNGPIWKYLAFAQLALAIPSVLTFVALTIGFFALAVRIIYPKALGFCSTGTKKTKRFILFAFFAECLLVGVVAFCAGVSLYFASNLNAACVPMYTRDYHQNQIDKFYNDIGFGATFVDYKGTAIRRSFVDVLYDDDITRPGYRDLIPDRSTELETDEWWDSVTEAILNNGREDIKFSGLPNVDKKLTKIKSDLAIVGSILLSDKTQSQLSSLVEEEINDFKEKFQYVYLRTVQEKTFSGYGTDHLSQRGSFKETVESSFRSFYHAYYDEFSRFWARPLRDGYMFTGQTMCVNFRTPAAGVWFAGTMLSMALLVSALVMWKTARHLELDFENKVPITISTIYSPLIDEEKNPKEQEI